MSELVQFVADYEREGEEVSFALLCRRYGISRKTGYKWIERWRSEGLGGLEARSRAPLHSPQAVPERLEEAIVGVRSSHRTWGPRKILAWLERHEPRLELCAVSTAGDILKRHGLVVPRRASRRATPSRSPLADCLSPNKTWCADFKGWFLLGNGMRCDPLTISDAHTRYLLRCQGLRGKTDHDAVRPVFEAAFEEHGLPERMRTDNGPPFATTGIGGLSQLSVWWIELGIEPERIRPAHPQENGRHERMHRTLKAETLKPAAHSLRTQQTRFDRWRESYNHERPHQALENKTPGSIYTRSQRQMPLRAAGYRYGDHVDEERGVRGSGQIKWRNRDIHIAVALAGRRLGLVRLSERYFEVYFRHILLGVMDSEKCAIIRPGKRMEEICKKLGQQNEA